MEIFLILAGMGIAMWAVMRRRARRKEIAFARELFVGHSYRQHMDAVLESHDIPLQSWADYDKLEQEVISVSQWIGKQSVLRSMRDASSLDDDDRFIAMLIAFVASDHLTRLANISFEVNSVMTCLDLNHALGGDLAPDAIDELIETHNAMATDTDQAKILQAIGNQVASFLAGDYEESLNKLGKLFSLMRENVEPAAEQGA